MKATLLALLLALPLLAVACGGSSDNQDGQRQGLPPGFPDSFPIFEGAQPIETTAEGNQIRVRFETVTPRQEITNFYRQVLDEPPWRVTYARDVVFENESFLTFQSLDKKTSGSVGAVRRKDSGLTNFIVALVLPSDSVPASTPEADATPTSQ